MESKGNSDVGTREIRIPILTYHSIDNSGSVISTAPDVFRRQMSFLSESRYRAITLAHLSERLRNREQIDPRTIVLTFDDGFENFYTRAYPVLTTFSFNATVFLVAQRCGGFNEWENPPSIPRARLMTWNQIREVAGGGIELGSHTLTHPDLTRVAPASAEREIGDSRKLIEDSVGGAVTSFAYPYGSYSQELKGCVANNYSIGCSTRMGKVQPDSDPMALERIDAFYLANSRLFGQLSTKRMDRYLQMRQILRTLRVAVSRSAGKPVNH